MANIVPRLLPERPFPLYAYVPGLFPHPGHSADESIQDEIITRGRLEEQLDLHWGLDLFHAGYYWEAHEAWETAWRRYDRRSPEGCFYQGLIKLAAAGVKAREGRTGGIRSHARRAVELWQAARQQGLEAVGNLQLQNLIADAEAVAASPERWVNTATDPVVRVFPFVWSLD